MGQYSWYDAVDGEEDLMQGDFIKECPVVIPPSELSSGMDVRIINYNVVIMSQSCDIVLRKLDFVLVCPIWPLNKLGRENEFFKGRKGKEALRQGNVPGYHLLNDCDIKGFETDYLVVDFRAVYSVPFDFILGMSKKQGKRLRLLPPYREHLSQAFARFFMRVGLPVDIPQFK